MLSLKINNNKGVSLIEVLISIVILVIGILATMSVFSGGYIYTTKSDLTGRAAEVLHRELKTMQAIIMSSQTDADIPGNTSKLVYPSGSSPKDGDVPYTIDRTVEKVGNIYPRWIVTVTVTWQGNTTGITESIEVMRDYYFGQGS